MSKIITDKEFKSVLTSWKRDVPTDREWDKFERSFDNKMLSAIKTPWFKKLFVSSFFDFSFLRACVCVSICALIGVISFGAIVRERSCVAAKQISRDYVQFVSDCMLTKNDDIDLSAGIHNISYVEDGINYVQDLIIFDGQQQTLAKK